MRLALTGAATGIGAEVARKAKEQGHEVIAFDITKPSVSVDQYVQVDLSDPKTIANAVNTTQGTFDALINNAGLPPREGLGRKVLEVNYFGLRDMTHAMVPRHARPYAQWHRPRSNGVPWPVSCRADQNSSLPKPCDPIPLWVAGPRY